MKKIYYASMTGWALGYRWAILDLKSGRPISIAKTLEEACQREKGYHYLGKRYKRVIVAIIPETVENYKEL